MLEKGHERLPVGTQYINLYLITCQFAAWRSISVFLKLVPLNSQGIFLKSMILFCRHSILSKFERGQDFNNCCRLSVFRIKTIVMLTVRIERNVLHVSCRFSSSVLNESWTSKKAIYTIYIYAKNQGVCQEKYNYLRCLYYIVAFQLNLYVNVHFYLDT